MMNERKTYIHFIRPAYTISPHPYTESGGGGAMAYRQHFVGGFFSIYILRVFINLLYYWPWHHIYNIGIFILHTVCCALYIFSPFTNHHRKRVKVIGKWKYDRRVRWIFFVCFWCATTTQILLSSHNCRSHSKTSHYGAADQYERGIYDAAASNEINCHKVISSNICKFPFTCCCRGLKILCCFNFTAYTRKVIKITDARVQH